jgi:PEP-CTERM motif
MKLAKKVLVASMLLASMSTHAAPVVVQFSGQIQAWGLIDYAPGLYQEVLLESSTLPGFVVRTGETFKGTLSYDDAQPLEASGDVYGLFKGWGTFSQSLSFSNGSVFANKNNVIMYLDADASAAYGNEYIKTQGSTDEEWNADRLSFEVFNYKSAEHNNATMPQAWEWAEYSTTDGTVRFGGYSDLEGYNVILRGNITNIAVVSSVPEPATYAMFAMGAVVLLNARRRKSR